MQSTQGDSPGRMTLAFPLNPVYIQLTNTNRKKNKRPLFRVSLLEVLEYYKSTFCSAINQRYNGRLIKVTVFIVSQEAQLKRNIDDVIITSLSYTYHHSVDPSPSNY